MRSRASQVEGSADSSPDPAAASSGAGSGIRAVAGVDRTAARREVSAESPIGPAPRVLSTDEFTERFAASARMLWTIAAGVVGNKAGADDVLQEAALTALTKLGEFDPRSNFTAWMARIVRFLALNQFRRDRKQPATLDPVDMDGVIAGRQDVDRRGGQLLDGRGQLNPDPTSLPFNDSVLRALASVGETARACLLLRTLEDLSYEEISAVLEIPPGTAMSHVHRTRILLREKLTGKV